MCEPPDQKQALMEVRKTPLSELIANLALDKFDSLPSRCKPRQFPDGSREWTPLSAIILTKHDTTPPILKLISLGTGTKSLAVSALSKCKGLILHDRHAEILALRGLNYWLLCEMERVATQNDYESLWLERQDTTQAQNSLTSPFRIREDVQISLFTTEAPCGDASMELLIAAAKASGADTSPWPSSQVPSALKASATQNLPPGRGGFAELGALRRKPARADAEVSMSMSCTDKLAMKQFTSLLGFPVDMLIEPNERAFLRRLVIYEDQYDATGYRRAFGRNGRLLKAFDGEDKSASARAYFFDVDVLPKEFRRFEYERIRNTTQQDKKSKVTNTSTVWVAGNPGKENSDIVEVLVNGVKQGYKQFDEKVKKGSVLCRDNMARNR